MTAFLTMKPGLFHYLIELSAFLLSCTTGNAHIQINSLSLFDARGHLTFCTTGRDGQEGFISYVSTTKDSLNNLVKRKICLCEISSENPFDV